MDAHRSDALTDTAIDRELQELLAVEPSPEFAVRVRAQIDAEPQRAPWLAWPRLVVGVAGLTVVVVTAIVTMREPESPQSAAIATPATAPAPPVPQVALDAQTPARVASHSGEHRARPQAHNAAGEVLMPRDEVRGMQRLLAMAARRDTRLTAMFEMPDRSATSPLPAPAPIVIEPIKIEPLVPDSY